MSAAPLGLLVLTYPCWGNGDRNLDGNLDPDDEVELQTSADGIVVLRLA